MGGKAGPHVPRWRQRMYEVIFESNTPAGKRFDILLLWAILLSILAVMLESVQEIATRYRSELRLAEWIFTAIFTAEYIARLIAVRKVKVYALSFLGIVDLLATLPTYLSLFLPGSQYLVVVRAIRLLRVFRIFKLSRYLNEGEVIKEALQASRPKIIVFLLAVLSIVTVVGTLMYLIEGPENGFNSIPRGIYWSIVTLTTVGFGDIVPKTFLGQVLASVIMIVGYAIIAVPTGIVTAELSRAGRNFKNKSCPHCNRPGHDADATFCKYCGGGLGEEIQRR